MLVLPVFTGGCAVLSKSQEREMGREEAAKLEEKVGIFKSKPYRSYVQNVGNRIAVYSDRSDLEYEFEILDTFLVNALALPGGFVYITRGLLKELETEAELAGVLAHELGHVNARHAEKRRQIRMATLLAGLAAAPATGGQSLIGGFVGQDMMARGYTREAEYEADELGFKYMITAGYKPRGLIDSLKRLQEISGEIPDYQLLIFRTHPYLVDRMRQIDLQQLEHRYAADTQLIERKSRYHRFRRRYLFQEEEKLFLARVENFLKKYENLN
ncbi:MAG: M48 family metalloprotease, partial [bacterium]